MSPHQHLLMVGDHSVPLTDEQLDDLATLVEARTLLTKAGIRFPVLAFGTVQLMNLKEPR